MMRIIHTGTFRALFVSAFLTCALHGAHAQFTYAGVTVEWDRTRLTGSGYEKTTHNQWAFVIGGMHRPLRNLALGAFLLAPISQSTGPGFAKAHTTDGSRFDNFEFAVDTEARYKPWTYKYEVEHKACLRLVARLFMEVHLNTYLEAGATFVNMEEQVNIWRPYVPPEYWYDGTVKYGAVDPFEARGTFPYTSVAPSIRVGMMPHLSKGAYLDLNVGWQFLNLSGDGFSYTFSHEWDYANEHHQYVTVESALPGSKKTFSVNAGIGTFF